MTAKAPTPRPDREPLPRVSLELVTPYNVERLKAVRHETIAAPDRLLSFGPWMRFDVDLSDGDWNAQHFLLRALALDIGWGHISRHQAHDTADLVLGLVPSARGKGYGTVGARLLLRHAFTVLGVRKVESRAFSSNPASVRMQKGGMRLEGTRRASVRIAGQVYDELLFGLLAEEWHEQVGGR